MPAILSFSLGLLSQQERECLYSRKVSMKLESTQVTTFEEYLSIMPRDRPANGKLKKQ